MQGAFKAELNSGLAEQVRADLLLCKGWCRAEVAAGEGEALVQGRLTEQGAARTVLPVPSTGSVAPEAMVRSLQDKQDRSAVVAFVDSDGAVSYFTMEQVDLRAPQTPNFF